MTTDALGIFMGLCVVVVACVGVYSLWQSFTIDIHKKHKPTN